MSAVVIDQADLQQQRRAAEAQRILSHYTPEQCAALRLLFDTADRMLDTGGGGVCARLLLGLYNGGRFPFDLTDLRRLDKERLQAAMTVILLDASHTWCEVHVLLNAIRGGRASTGLVFENWAYRLGLKGRCRKDQLPALHPGA